MTGQAGDDGRSEEQGRIVVRSLSHWYDTAGAGRPDRVPPSERVLNDVDLEVEAGTFVSVLGPSGCGKTTLLRIIGGLVRPTEGAVEIDGRRVTGPPQSTATVFQDHNLFPWRKALHNVEFPLELLGVQRSERRAKAMESLRRVGLEKYANNYPRQLSGGMQQRVGIARALSVEPQLLLMDEPFGALDAQTRESMQEELLALWERDRRTVVFVTHSIEEAVYLSDRVVVLEAHPGQIRAEVAIDAPRPRSDDEGFRTSDAMIEYRRQLGALLRH